MSAAPTNIIPMPSPQTRPTHPEGAPFGLSTNPVDLNALALNLAHVCGRQWETMTVVDLDAYKQAALLAAWMVQPDALAVIARHVLHFTNPAAADAHPIVRAQLLDEIVIGLREAMRMVAGGTPEKHARIMRLAAFDADQRAERLTRGGF